MNVPVLQDGSIEQRAAADKPGDYVRLRAEMDCIVVASACPQDVTGINNHEPSRIRLEVC